MCRWPQPKRLAGTGMNLPGGEPPLSTIDTLIAATAIAKDAILITANVKDFPMEEIEILEQL